MHDEIGTGMKSTKPRGKGREQPFAGEQPNAEYQNPPCQRKSYLRKSVFSTFGPEGKEGKHSESKAAIPQHRQK
jgi:hypothetical protein